MSQNIFSQSDSVRPLGEGKVIYKTTYAPSGKMVSLEEYIPEGRAFFRYEMTENAKHMYVIGFQNIGTMFSKCFRRM